MGYINKDYKYTDIEDWKKEMMCCPFCGSEKVKLTEVSKGSYKGNKVQGLCNRCYARGPAASNPKDATLMWNGRNGSLVFEQFTLNSKQLEKVLTEDVILNPTSEFEMKVILNTLKTYSDSFKQEVSYLWGRHEKYTTILVKSSLTDKDEYYFGFSDINYAKEIKPQAKIEIPKIVRIKN